MILCAKRERFEGLPVDSSVEAHVKVVATKLEIIALRKANASFEINLRIVESRTTADGKSGKDLPCHYWIQSNVLEGTLNGQSSERIIVRVFDG